MKIRKTGLTALVLWTALFASSVELRQSAASEDGKSAESAQIIEKNGQKYKVTIEKNRKKIRVLALTPPKPAANQMVVKIRSGNEILDRVNVGLIKTPKNEVVYQGNLNMNQQSMVGLQFEIELGKTAE